jgi:hypothetical protein
VFNDVFYNEITKFGIGDLADEWRYKRLHIT